MGRSQQQRSLTWPQIALLVAIIALAGWWQLRQESDGTTSAPPASTSSAPEPQTPSRPPPASSPAPITASRYDLGRDEERGGHTLERHVGKSDADLRARLARERNISAASTYPDRETAERTVANALARNEKRVATWLARDGNRPNLALNYRGASGEVLGRTLERGASDAEPSRSAVVVLRWDGDRDFYVLTSYPESDR